LGWRRDEIGIDNQDLATPASSSNTLLEINSKEGAPALLRTAGQEFSGIAVAAHIEPGDLIFSNHRCHGHYLGRTGAPRVSWPRLWAAPLAIRVFRNLRSTRGQIFSGMPGYRESE
jgi:TPP-dependent pyruvate/acetoin dehydrogenase alpha subunit